jgi:hypothetical protein
MMRRDVTDRGDCARFGALLFGLAALLLASACAEVELVSHAAKQVQPGGQGRGDGHYKVSGRRLRLQRNRHRILVRPPVSRQPDGQRRNLQSV